MQRCTPDDNGQKAGGVVVKREEITMFIGLRLPHSLFGTIAQTWHQLMMVYHRQFDHILPLGKCRQRKKTFVSITALLYRRKEQTEGADTTPSPPTPPAPSPPTPPAPSPPTPPTPSPPTPPAPSPPTPLPQLQRL